MATAMLTKHKIFDLLEQSQPSLNEFGVKQIGLFGSFVHGDEHAASDIDLLVEFEPAHKTFDMFMGLCFYLDDLLQRQVEVVTVDSLSPYIGPYILEEVEYAFNMGPLQIV